MNQNQSIRLKKRGGEWRVTKRSTQTGGVKPNAQLEGGGQTKGKNKWRGVKEMHINGGRWNKPKEQKNWVYRHTEVYKEMVFTIKLLI